MYVNEQYNISYDDVMENGIYRPFQSILKDYSKIKTHLEMKLSQIVADNTARFAFFRGKSMYYTIDVEGSTYQFEVPISEVDEATFNAEDKAIFFMRWIRKAIEKEEFYKIK